MQSQKDAGIKFMQVLDPKIYREMRGRAEPLGITIQELIRVKVIPEFLYGPIQLNPQLVKQLTRDGYFSAHKVWNGRKPK